MKKFIIVVALFATTLGLLGQDSRHSVQSFINDRVGAIVVSNASGTITVPGITNLNSGIPQGFSGFGTNYLGTTWTNKDASYVIETAVNASSTNDVSGINLIKDVNLYPDRVGSMPYVWATGTGSGASNNIIMGTITMRLVGRSGKSGTVNLRFAPVYDGTNEPTGAAEVFVWGVAVNSTTPVVACTNLYQFRVAGARKFRLREIYNSDTGAGTDAFITDLNFSGFAP